MTLQKTQESQTIDPDQIFSQAPYEEELDPSDRAGGTSTPGTKFYAIAQNQGTNMEKIQHAGQFYTKTEEGGLEFTDHLDVVILDSGPRSTRFGDDGQVACRSYDGVTGTNGKRCKECPYYFFSENEIPKDKKCKNSRVLLCVPGGDWNAEPFFLQISPAGIRDWQKYANDLQIRYRRPVFSAVTRITTTLRKENKGMAFVPVFTPIKALTIDETAVLRDIRIAESYRFRPPEPQTTSAGDTSRAGALQVDDIMERDPFAEE